MPTVLITGATKGIGQSAAKLFAKSGWDLLLVARTEDKLRSLSQEIKSQDLNVSFQSIDLAKPDSIAPSLEELIQRTKEPVSVLINNAGSAWTGDLLSMPLNEWHWLLQINLTSIFQVCSAVVPSMRANGGLIINVSSHASRNAFPQWGAYCTTKAALAAFTKCLGEEERANGIRACTLTLGAVNTSLWDSETIQADFDRNAMLPAEEAAQALLYLAQQPSSQVVEDITLMPSTGAF